ncbi:MAG: HK97 gp10 family phage protein [Chloroflexales bacterium]
MSVEVALNLQAIKDAVTTARRVIVSELAQRTADTMRRDVPRVTGTLARSIRVMTGTDEAYAEATAPYALIVDQRQPYAVAAQQEAFTQLDRIVAAERL